MCCGRATSCPEPSGCTSGPPRPGQQRRGEGRWASAFHCCCLDGWGRGGPAAAPGSPITGQGWWESQTQRSLHPAFGIPEVSLLGPLASPGASPASLCPGGQGARVHLPGTHACPASPPQGPSPQGVCPPPLPAPGGGGLPCGCRFTSVQVYTRLGACPPCPQGTAGTGPPSPAPDQQQWRRQGIRRLAGAWPPDLCPLRRWRPQSPRTWWSTTRAPGTPACWPQTASCPSCSASLTAASTAWPSSQVPS